MAVLGSPSLIVRMVSVDVEQHLKKESQLHLVEGRLAILKGQVYYETEDAQKYTALRM